MIPRISFLLALETTNGLRDLNDNLTVVKILSSLLNEQRMKVTYYFFISFESTPVVFQTTPFHYHVTRNQNLWKTTWSSSIRFIYLDLFNASQRECSFKPSSFKNVTSPRRPHFLECIQVARSPHKVLFYESPFRKHWRWECMVHYTHIYCRSRLPFCTVIFERKTLSFQCPCLTI